MVKLRLRLEIRARVAAGAEGLWVSGAAVGTVVAGLLGATPGWGVKLCVLPPLVTPTSSPRAVTAADIVGLRDFGDLGTDSSEEAMAVSPDGRSLALQLRQGEPASNDYCTALVVLPTASSGKPEAIADTGTIVPDRTDLYGMADMTLGAAQTAPLAWSPDGQWIAFVKTRADGADIWRIRPDGREAALVYASPVPIEALAWRDDDKGLIITSQPELVAARHQIVKEGQSGFHYDARFWPLTGMEPHPLASSVPAVTQVIDVETGAVGPANARALVEIAPTSAPSWPKKARFAVSAGEGALQAWAVPDHPGWIRSQPGLHATVSGRAMPCIDEACEDVTGLWLLSDRRTLLFLRRSSVARSQTSLYRWRPDAGAPRRLFVTDDAIFGCHQASDDLVCAHESSRQPRTVVSIDGQTGAITPLFDPNPEWRDLTLGQVERLTWRNSFGIETFGDLVLPAGYRPGKPLPLIVVQYESRGFLRGGTADDYPIQLYAAHGFAVLSFNRPPFFAVRDGPKSPSDFFRINQQGWADRRNVQSSLATIIDELVARGIADPTRIGITGQSDGASTATFALIHSHLFAAAAISTCCEDADIMATLGEGFADRYGAMGYPHADQPAPDFWMNSALDLHAGDRRVPILVQASDQEARMGLRTYAVLKGAGWPIEMYVFPGEGHVKIQPAHRLALFERSLAWFETWLGAPKVNAVSAPEAVAQPPQLAAQASTSMH